VNNRQRVNLFFLTAVLVLAVACNSATPAPASMAGFWADPDENVTTIQQQNGNYVAVTTFDLFQSHSQNSLVSSSYENGVLTWKYCPPAKPCITLKTEAFNGNTLDVSWVDANGGSGKMTLKRVDKGTN